MKNILYKISYLTFLILLISVKSYSQYGWYPLNSGTTQNLNSLYGNFYIAGDSGIILKGINYGNNWIRIQSPTTNNLNSIWFEIYDSKLLIAGDSGKVYITYNSGSSWILQNTGTTSNLNSIKSIVALIIAVGNDGAVMKSTNNGNNWNRIECETNVNLNYVILNSLDNFIAAGDNGLILKSTNGGSNWMNINSGTTSDLNFISSSDLISGNNGVVLKSTDGGNSWNSMTTGTTLNLKSICQNSGLAWAVGENGIIIKSYDHGSSWIQQNSGTTEDLNAVEFIYQNSGWASGNSGLILKHNQDRIIDAFKQLDANQIRTWFRNNGSCNRDPQTGNGGFEWPINSGLYARYTSGLWLGCIIGNDTITSASEYSSDYTNGYINNNGFPMGQSDSSYRIYKIFKGDSTSSDYLSWPVNQGAYVNSSGRPFFLGTQTMFYVYIDSYSHFSGQTGSVPLKAQVLQTNWAYNHPGYLENVIFTEFRVINRSTNIWNNFYLGIWNDDDAYIDNGRVATDTLRNLGYSYNADNSDPQYGAAPPAVGNNILRGLLKYTGNIYDTVKYYNPPGSNNLISKVGYKDLKMTVSNRHNNSSPQPGSPYNSPETYKVLEGKWRDGTQWINPVTQSPTTFVHSGDPVTGTGWNQTYMTYKRTLQSTGPVTVNPGDTISVLYAQLIARGTDNINSITKLRETADYIQQIYDENFQSVVSIKNISNEIPAKYELYQNYPNPFNPVTHLEFEISNPGFVSLKVYDMLGKEIKTLVNENKTAGRYAVEFDGSNLPSGIYYYKMVAGKFSNTKDMVLLK